MADNIVQPMDFNPVNTGAHATTYTVPSGKYAFVQVELLASAYATADDTVAGGSTGGSVNINAMEKIAKWQGWLKTGDVLATSGSNASGTASATSGTFRLKAAKASTTIEATLNSTSFLKAIATCQASFYGALATGIDYAVFDGAREMRIQYSEYNNIV